MQPSISDNQPDDDSLFYGSKLPPLDPEKDLFSKTNELLVIHPNNPIISYLNINSIRNKFENFTDMISEYVDVIVIAQTKLDDTFPKSKFSLPGFKAL